VDRQSPTARSRRRRLLACAAGALAAFQFVGGTSTAQSEGSVVPSTGVLRICSGCSDHGLGDGSRYRYVILQTWQYDKIKQLKAANPSIRVLVYKNVAATVDYGCRNGIDDSLLPTGVGYCWTNAHHPGWFLTDAGGSRINFCSYRSHWLMDVGAPAYRKAWLRNTVSDAKRYGFDGVLLDDVDEWMDTHLCGRTIARYPTHEGWSAATLGFMAAVGPALKRQGLLAFPNVAITDYWTSNGLSYWDKVLSYSSGAVQEYYTKWGSGSSSWFTDDGGFHNDWSYRQAYLQRTQAAGKPYIGVTYAPKDDTRSQRYARGSFLLDWDGGASSLVYEPTDPEAQDPYSATWTTSPGSPVGSRYRVGPAWRRDYSRGTVIVNPSTGPVTVSLGGPFAQPDGTVVSTITLDSADAAILVRVPPV